MSEPTHILQIWPSQKQEVLFRASDGIRLATRSQQTVIFGDDPNKGRSHVFVSEEKAVEFIKSLARRDIHGELPLQDVKPGHYQQPAFISRFPGTTTNNFLREAVIDEQQMEGKVVLAEGSIDLPNFHGVRKM